MPIHPFDRVLRQYGWARQTFETLPPRIKPKAKVCLLVITPRTEGKKEAVSLVAVEMWQQSRKASVSVTEGQVPDILQPILIRSLVGLKPPTLGLSQCRCTGHFRWNPYMLPLVQHPAMTRDRLRAAIDQYLNLVHGDQSWACPDPSHLVP